MRVEKFDKIRVILKLLCLSLYIGAVAFGGGFVSLSLIKKTYNEKLKWISDDEFIEFSALSQTAPGSISINLSMLIGHKVAGIIGVVVSLIGSIIPPFLVITSLYYFYDYIKGYVFFTLVLRGMQAGVSAVILSLVIDLIKQTFSQKDTFAVVIMILTFLIGTASLFFFNFSAVIYLVILSIILGVGYSYLTAYKEAKNGEKK